MAKKQTRRSISVSRATYERLKAFCETNNISMSQLVETRVNDFLGGDVPALPPPSVPQHTPVHHGFATAPSPFRSVPTMAPRPVAPPPVRPVERPVAVERPIMSAPIAAPVQPVVAAMPAPAPVVAPQPAVVHTAPVVAVTNTAPAAAPAAQVPMTSAAARFAVEPPPPIIKPRQDTVVPKPAEKRADQIFTF